MKRPREKKNRLTILFEVPRKTWVKVAGARIFFDHLDGMYSYCLTEKGAVCHLYCGELVEILKDQPPPPK